MGRLKQDTERKIDVPFGSQRLIHGDAVVALDNHTRVCELADESESLDIRLIKIQRPISTESNSDSIEATALADSISRRDVAQSLQLLSSGDWDFAGLNTKDCDG